jgi:hypothetical protein
MTGTPLDLTSFGSLLSVRSALSNGFGARRLVVALSAVSLFIGCAARSGADSTEFKERQAKAQAMFAQRCKTAGEKIYRTVDNIEGVYLMKVRPDTINYDNQFVLDDPYGSDLGGKGYITTFIRGSYQANVKDIPKDGPPRIGYSYVEALDPKDRQRYRYTGRIEEPWQTDKSYLKGYMKFVLYKNIAPSDSAPQYGVTYDDISTREEREYWIAGSSLKVIDLKNNEVIAERIGYMMDFYQGSNKGGRAPWLWATAHACPNFLRNFKTIYSSPISPSQDHQTLDFVEKVLHSKPIQGN